jgi:hypothetical protein
MSNKPIMTEHPNGTKSWHLNGYFHRTDGPAVEDSNGHKEWWLNGKHHRIDGPAVEYPDGTKSWYLNGNHHREDGPAVEYSDGTFVWYLNDILYYHIKGKLHNNNFLVSDQYTGPVIIMGGKNKIKFMRTINNKYLVIEEQ